MPVAVAGVAEVVEVVVVEHVLVGRSGGFLQGFLFFASAAIAFPAFASAHVLLLPAGHLGIGRRDRLHGGGNRRQFDGLAGFIERGSRLRPGKDRLRVGAGYHQRRQPSGQRQREEELAGEHGVLPLSEAGKIREDVVGWRRIPSFVGLAQVLRVTCSGHRVTFSLDLPAPSYREKAVRSRTLALSAKFRLGRAGRSGKMCGRI